MKGTVVPLFNSAPRHEHVWRLEVYLHAFVASAPEGGEWAASRPGQFNHGKEPLVLTEWETGWVPEVV